MGVRYDSKRLTDRDRMIIEKLNRDISVMDRAWSSFNFNMGVDRPYRVSADMTDVSDPVVEGIYLSDKDIMVRCKNVSELINDTGVNEHVYARYFDMSVGEYMARRRKWLMGVV